jgi:hypothetical protein
MAVHKYGAVSAVQTMLTTELNSLANAATSNASSAFANSGSGNRYLQALFELVCTFASAPTAGKPVDLYILPTVDGTNYADGGGSTVPSAASYAGSFAVRNSASAQRLVLEGIVLPPGDFKLLLINNSGQAMAASGNTLKMVAYAMETV